MNQADRGNTVRHSSYIMWNLIETHWPGSLLHSGTLSYLICTSQVTTNCC